MPWLIQDLHFGLRSISKDRSFFFTSVLALALGIGATTVIFSVIDNVLLNPFPYLDSERIYDIDIQDRTSHAAFPRNWFSVPGFGNTSFRQGRLRNGWLKRLHSSDAVSTM